MSCLVIFMYRGTKCNALIQEATEDNWFDKFRSQHNYDNIIGHMFIG